MNSWLLRGGFVGMAVLVAPSVFADPAKPTLLAKEMKRVNEHKLVDIESEPEEGLIHKLSYVKHANGDLSEMIRRTDNPEAEQRIAVSEMQKGEVILARKDGHDAVMISCPKCQFKTSDVVRVKYLHNGVFKNYRTDEFRIVKQSNGAWKLFTMKKNEEIRKMRLVAKRWFGKIIGIDKIEINPKFRSSRKREWRSIDWWWGRSARTQPSLSRSTHLQETILDPQSDPIRPDMD